MPKVGKIVIDKNIGEYDEFAAMFGESQPCFSSNDMRTAIDNNADADELEVEIRCNGGSVTQGFEIYDMLVNSGKTVTTVAYKANSIATVIFLAGTKRKISKNASFVIHNPYIDPYALGYEGLTADDLLEISEEVRQCEEKIFSMYVERLGLDETAQQEVRDLMKQDTDLGSDKALKYGFATEVISGNVSAMTLKSSACYSNKIAALLKDKHKQTIDMVTKEEFKNEIGGIKSILADLKNLFSKKVKNGTAQMSGTTVYFEGETVSEGTVVYTDEAMTTTVDPGTYTDESGNSVVVGEGGVIESITLPTEDATVEQLQNKVADLENKLAQAEANKQTAIDAAVDQVQNAVKEKMLQVENKLKDLEKFVPAEADTKTRFVAAGTKDLGEEVQKRLELIRNQRQIGRAK